MAVRTRVVSGTGVSADSTALECQAGKCAIQIYSSSSLEAEIHISLDGTNWSPARDPAGDADIGITADGVYAVDVPVGGAQVRIDRAAGTYSYIIKQD